MRGRWDKDSWERRWSQALGERAHAVAGRPPNAHLVAEVSDLWIEADLATWTPWCARSRAGRSGAVHVLTPQRNPTRDLREPG